MADTDHFETLDLMLQNQPSICARTQLGLTRMESLRVLESYAKTHDNLKKQGIVYEHDALGGFRIGLAGNGQGELYMIIKGDHLDHHLEWSSQIKAAEDYIESMITSKSLGGQDILGYDEPQAMRVLNFCTPYKKEPRAATPSIPAKPIEIKKETQDIRNDINDMKQTKGSENKRKNNNETPKNKGKKQKSISFESCKKVMPTNSPTQNIKINKTLIQNKPVPIPSNTVGSSNHFTSSETPTREKVDLYPTSEKVDTDSPMAVVTNITEGNDNSLFESDDETSSAPNDTSKDDLVVSSEDQRDQQKTKDEAGQKDNGTTQGGRGAPLVRLMKKKVVRQHQYEEGGSIVLEDFTDFTTETVCEKSSENIKEKKISKIPVKQTTKTKQQSISSFFRVNGK